MTNHLNLKDHAVKAYNEKWGYIYGSYGQKASRSLINSCTAKYPEMYTPAYIKLCMNWVEPEAHMVADCSGLIKSLLMKTATGAVVYNSKYDLGTSRLYDLAPAKGAIGTLPEQPGILVWHKGHVGVYIGNGEVIEARGAAYGVVKTKLTKDINQSNWTHWLKHPYIDYTIVKTTVPAPVVKPAPVAVPVAKPAPVAAPALVATKPVHLVELGDKGGDVLWIEQKLKAVGFNPGPVNGVFDAALEAGVKAFQAKYQLKVDGVVGPITIALLAKPVMQVRVNPYPDPSFASTIAKGAYGSGVKWIQWILNDDGLYLGQIDGSYGPVTEGCVRTFQRKYGLSVDGVAGPKTLAKLNAFDH
jgi:peptidoglycan hydrolase-like protein with peptidoglycan-binding domain